jgi:hypothetical protein
MGFLDNLIKAVESGDLEKRLESVADKLEGISENVTQKVEKLADAPGKVIGGAAPGSDSGSSDSGASTTGGGSATDATDEPEPAV